MLETNQSANLRREADMSTLANRIVILPKGTKFESFVKNGEWYLVSGWLHETVVKDTAPQTYPYIYPEIPYRSQWSVDADDRPSDCGQACTAMLCQALGVYVAINSLPFQSDQAGYTTAAHLVQNAASVGVKLRAVNYTRLEDIPLPSILLVNYGAFPNEEIQDTGFNGLHWLVVKELLPDGRARVNDPDYYNHRIKEGENKVYSKFVVDNAFRVSGKYQCVHV